MNGNELVHPIHLSANEPQIVSSGLSPTVPRDLMIIVAAHFVGGFPHVLYHTILGREAMPSCLQLGCYAFHCALLILAFAAIACLAYRSRWRHLLHVALAAWLLDVVMTLTLNCAPECILHEALILPLTMALGGALSYLFKPRLVAP